MKTIFTFLVFVWPLAVFLTMFMFDSPSAGGVPVYMLFYSTIFYGPVYLITLVLALSLKRRNKTELINRTWLVLCGGNVALWILSFILVSTICHGAFACR